MFDIPSQPAFIAEVCSIFVDLNPLSIGAGFSSNLCL
jgi:hypothetical protein